MLEKFKCWKLFLLVLKERVFDRNSSFMVRACERRSDAMVTVISELRTLVRSDLAIAASSINEVLEKKLKRLRDERSVMGGGESLSQQLVNIERKGERYDYRKLKELVEQCDKDETKKDSSTHHWPRALVDVDDDVAYDTMSYGRLQEALDIVVSCQGLVEEFVFNFEAPPGSLNAFSPLHHTCNAQEEMIDSVQTLAKAKVDVNAKGKYGLTPLHIACLRGHVRVVEELLAYNANSAQPTRLDGLIFHRTGREIIMNTLEIHKEAVVCCHRNLEAGEVFGELLFDGGNIAPDFLRLLHGLCVVPCHNFLHFVQLLPKAPVRRVLCLFFSGGNSGVNNLVLNRIKQD